MFRGRARARAMGGCSGRCRDRSRGKGGLNCIRTFGVSVMITLDRVRQGLGYGYG